MSSIDRLGHNPGDGSRATRKHDPERMAFGVAVAFATTFTVTVVLGSLLELGWGSGDSTAVDSEVTRWFVDHRTPTWTDAMRIVTWLGSSWVVIPLAVVVVVGLLVGRRRWLALFVVLAVGGASLLERAREGCRRTGPPTRRHTPPTSAFIGVPVGTLDPSRSDVLHARDRGHDPRPVARVARGDLAGSDADCVPRRCVRASISECTGQLTFLAAGCSAASGSLASPSRSHPSTPHRLRTSSVLRVVDRTGAVVPHRVAVTAPGFNAGSPWCVVPPCRHVHAHRSGNNLLVKGTECVAHDPVVRD